MLLQPPSYTGSAGTTPDMLPALHCTALHCTALHCTALHCTALYCTALHCNAKQCNAMHCTALHCTALLLILYCYLSESTMSWYRLMPAQACTFYCHYLVPWPSAQAKVEIRALLLIESCKRLHPSPRGLFLPFGQKTLYAGLDLLVFCKSLPDHLWKNLV